MRISSISKADHLPAWPHKRDLTSAASRLRIASTKPGFVDDDLSLLEGDTPFLSAVVDDVAVGLLALLSRPRDRLGAHPEHRLDGGATHDINEVVEGTFRVFEEIEQWQEDLAVSLTKLRSAWDPKARDCLEVE